MKKWFTTNYHYLVPEFDSSTEVRLNGTKPFDEYLEAKSLGIETKPVLIGPYTFKLSRDAEAQELTIDEGLVDAVADVYAEVLRRFAKLGAQWVQLDEPYLVLDKHEGDVSLFKSLYFASAAGAGSKACGVGAAQHVFRQHSRYLRNSEALRIRRGGTRPHRRA